MDEQETMNVLTDYGLKDKEIRVYLACLKIGTSKVNDIARQANILRETTYFTLKSLIEKGLVSYVMKGGVKHFEAASPNKLITILKEREVKINSVLPFLLKLEKSVKEKPKVELYEGKEGLKTVIDDLIKTGKPMVSFSSTGSLVEKLQFYFPNYIKRRVENKIPIKVLTEKTKTNLDLQKRDNKEFREIRFISKEYAQPNAIFIYGNKIAILDLEKNLVGIIIENEDLNKTFRSIFQMVWDNAQ